MLTALDRPKFANKASNEALFVRYGGLMVVRRIHSRNIRRNEDILDFLHSTVFLMIFRPAGFWR